MSVRSVSLLALSCALAAPAAAADFAVDAPETGTIVVTGIRDSYSTEATSTATRTPTELNDIPQAITIVTERQIEDQAIMTIADVLRNVPGATIGQGEGHRDQITIRGNNSTSDFFVDGLRDDVQYYRGLYNVERIEILKGPNAMIFGRGGGGGVINRVLKRPAANPFARGTGSVDSEGAFLFDIDVNQPFGEAAAGRFNAVYEDFNTHRDFYEGRRFALNPTVAFSIGGLTRIDLSYEHNDDERVVDRGVPSFAGTPLRGFRDSFFGDPDVNRADFAAHILRGRLEHRFSDTLTLSSKLLYGDYDKAYQNVFPATAVTSDAAGVRQLGLEAYRDTTERENFFSQNDLVWEIATGPLSHAILAGFEYGDQDTANERINGFFTGVPTSSAGRRTIVRLSDPLAVPDVQFRAGAAFPGNRRVATEAEVLAFYLQDQIAIGQHVELVAGVRHDRFELRVDNLFNSDSFSRTDSLWSPRLGLVLKPLEPVSIYASYSRSFLPQSGDQFLSLDLTAAALEPEKFDNYEIGLKWNIRPTLNLTAALYQLDRTNTRAAGATPGTVVLTGEQRSKGLEISLAGEIQKNWRISAGYALQDAEIRRGTSAAPAGREVPQVPQHQANLWTRYDFTPRIGAGFGVYHQSKSFASISNAVVIPSFTRVDAAAFFRLTDQIEAQLNVQNLLGEVYFPTAHTNITPGAPTAVRGTLRFSF
jgi:catecholate siderophore receptor